MEQGQVTSVHLQVDTAPDGAGLEAEQGAASQPLSSPQPHPLMQDESAPLQQPCPSPPSQGQMPLAEKQGDREETLTT